MLSFVYSNALGHADLRRGADGLLVDDDELLTAVTVSLFTDLGREDASIGDERGGWWGDFDTDEDGEQIGSRLWQLLSDGAVDTLTSRRLEDEAVRALSWLERAGAVSDLSAEVVGTGRDSLHLVITLTDETAATRRMEFAL